MPILSPSGKNCSCKFHDKQGKPNLGSRWLRSHSLRTCTRLQAINHFLILSIMKTRIERPFFFLKKKKDMPSALWHALNGNTFLWSSSFSYSWSKLYLQSIGLFATNTVSDGGQKWPQGPLNNWARHFSLHHLPESYLPYLWDEEWDLGRNCNLILLLVQRYSKTAENIFSSVFQV